ncbi:MAG TPA: hypothetical protein VF212_09755 [Longimicrobiales bacterium]
MTAVYLVWAPMEHVWGRLPQVYAALGLEAGVIDAASKVYGTRQQRLGSRLAGERPSEFLDCGRTPAGAEAADIYSLTLSVDTTLEEDGEATIIRTRIGALARPRTASASMVTCTSTGALEAIIARLIGAK